MPNAHVPVDRTVEIVEIAESPVLPIDEDMAHIDITVCPINAEDVRLAADATEVVEVYLIGSLVLVLSEVELVSHLVGEEERLLARLLEAHGAGIDYCNEGDKGE